MAPQTPAQARQILKILHLALTSSVAIYGVVAFVATPARDAGFHRPTDVILYVLAGLAATMLIVVAPMIHRMMMPPVAERETAGHKVKVASIVTWALCESAAVNGLIAAFLYREPLYFLPFGAAAVAGLIVFAPRD